MRGFETATRAIPFSGAPREELVAQRAFNREVGKTIGADAPAITQQVWQKALDRTSDTFERIEGSFTVRQDSPLLADFRRIRADARTSLDDGEFGSSSGTSTA
jgi:hypothetical protein